MAEPPSVNKGTPATGQDTEHLPSVFSTSDSSSVSGKRLAAAVSEGNNGEDLQDEATTLDDVVAPPLSKRFKLLDEELPDVDDNEEFPQQMEEMDEEVTSGAEMGENEIIVDEESLITTTRTRIVERREFDTGNEHDVNELAPPDDDEVDSDGSVLEKQEIDVVEVDNDEEEEEKEGYEPFSEEGEEDDDEEDAEASAQAFVRAQNQREGRQLLLQLNDSTRSKLCLTALEKYGEELFYGHEDARDAILVDACAQDAVLSLMRDAIQVKDMYLRGSSAAAPLELDDDEEEKEDDQEREDEIGGYEDEEEDAEEEEEVEEKAAGSITEDHDDEVVVISEVGEEDGADSEALNSTTSSPGSEVPPSGAAHFNVSGGGNGEEVNEDMERMPRPAGNEGYVGDYSEQGIMEGDVGATSDSASGLPIDDEGS